MTGTGSDGDASDVVARLRAVGCVFAEDEARLLTEQARTPDELQDLVRRRIAGEPLEHVLGWAGFAGLRIAVEPGVFVPRRRTELLVHEVVRLLRGRVEEAGRAASPVVVDLCCGSGAVGAAVARAVPGITLHAADVDPAAVRCARRNVAPVGGAVHAGDLFDALPPGLRGRVDVLVANAPYVPTGAIGTMPPEARSHEPRVALDGGPDGLDVVRRVAAHAGGWLAPGGHLVVETSTRQAGVVLALLAAGGFDARLSRCEELDATGAIGRAPDRS